MSVLCQQNRLGSRLTYLILDMYEGTPNRREYSFGPRQGGLILILNPQLSATIFYQLMADLAESLVKSFSGLVVVWPTVLGKELQHISTPRYVTQFLALKHGLRASLSYK